jgi:hypothetical protein
LLTVRPAFPRSKEADMNSAAAPVDVRIFSSDPTDPEEEPRRLGKDAPAAALATGRSVVICVAARFTTAVRADGDRLIAVRIVSHGPVSLAASQAEAASANGMAAARMLRAAANQVAERARLEKLADTTCAVVGTAGIARAVITLGSDGGSKATLEQVHAATERLAVSWVEAKRTGHAQNWIVQMMIGAAVLGAVLESLGVSEVQAEDETPVDKTLEGD